MVSVASKQDREGDAKLASVLKAWDLQITALEALQEKRFESRCLGWTG